MGGRQTHPGQSVHAFSGSLGAAALLEGNRRSVPHFMRRTRRHLWLGTPHIRSYRPFGVDEIQYGKGHKYVTLVYQIDLGVTRLFSVGKERTFESFQKFFTLIGEEIAAQIVFICSDMGAVPEGHPRKMFPGPAYPRPFPYRGQMNKALDEVRAANRAYGGRGDGSGAEEVALAAAAAVREPANRTALSTARCAALQPEDRPGLPSEGSFSATLGLQLPCLGRKVPR